MNFNPSYKNYKLLLDYIIKTNKYKDFVEVNSGPFVVLRHDVEFSVLRAYKMACLEFDSGIKSSYFFQTHSNSYNILSKKNTDLIKRIINMGHKVGLHFYHTGITDYVLILNELKKQLDILEKQIGLKVDRFSIHRPTELILSYNLSINGYINTYQEKWFSFFKNSVNANDLPIKYISDSGHQWNYGFPNSKTLKLHDKIQILIHPFSWSECGETLNEVFSNLITENTSDLTDTFSNEFKKYGLIKK